MADKYIIGLYQDLEREVTADIARRVKKTGRYTETAELQAKFMREQGYSTSKIQAEVMKMLRADKDYQMFVAENTKQYKAEVQKIIDDTVKEAKAQGDKLVASAGNMSFNNDLDMWSAASIDLKKDGAINQIMLAFRKQTQNELKNLTRTMAFKDTVFGTTGVMNAYQKEVDRALLKVATGTFSFDQAVNDCVHRLAQSGLRTVDYANGRTYQLDTAARMSVRTSLSQMAGRITEHNIEKTGVDLVIVSQHAGSRPEHAPLQNRVFVYEGKSKKYPSFKAPIESGGAGYGFANGIKGINCTHSFYPYWEGISVKEPDIPYDEELYENTQTQRRMERNIRATKREIEAQRAIGGDTSQLNAKLRAQSVEYKEFSESVGLKPKNNRLSVVGGTSAPKKNVPKTSNKKAKTVENTDKNSIIFTKADNVEDAKRFAKDILGLEYYDMEKVNIDCANMMNKELANIYNTFGNLANSGYLSGIRHYPKKVDWVAAYAPSMREIFVRNVSAKNALEKMAQTAKTQFEYGFWSDGDAEHGIRHEAGHAIQHLFTDKDADKLNKISEMRKQVMKECGIDQWSARDTKEHMKAAGNIISYYALKTDGEFIAEAVAEYMNGKPREMAKKIIGVLLEGR